MLPAASAVPLKLSTTTASATDVASIGISNVACSRNAAPGSSTAPFAGVIERRCGGCGARLRSQHGTIASAPGAVADPADELLARVRQTGALAGGAAAMLVPG